MSRARSSSLDSLIDQMVVEDNGVERQRRNSAERQPPPLDIKALQEKLNAVAEKYARSVNSRTSTPSPDEEQARLYYIECEEAARARLIQDGCPPCYPAESGIIYDESDFPDEYKEGVGNWLRYSAWPLAGQLADWQRFRGYQDRIRQYYVPRGRFPEFDAKVRDRRRRHGHAETTLRLGPDRIQQSRQQDWLEFQNYHLNFHEEKQAERDGVARELADARREKDGAGESEPDEFTFDPGECADLADDDVFFYTYRLSVAEGKLSVHAALLRWIEKQRLAMAAPLSDAAEDGPISSRLRPRRQDERQPAEAASSQGHTTQGRGARLARASKDAPAAAEAITSLSRAKKRPAAKKGRKVWGAAKSAGEAVKVNRGVEERMVPVRTRSGREVKLPDRFA